MMMKKQVREELWIDILLVVAVLAVLVPLLWILATSLKGRFDISAKPLKFLFQPTLDNYRTVFLSDRFLRYFSSSAIIAVSSTVVSLFFGSMAAYSITRHRTGGDFLPFWILSQRMLPPIVIILPVYILMRNLGLLDTYWSIIIMHTLINLPFAIWLMTGFFREVPDAIDEAAVIDGCSIFKAYFRIILPIVTPGLLATGIFCLVASWNEFLFALVLSGRTVTTLPVATAFYVTDRDILWGPMTAVGVTAMIPIIVFTLLIQKYLVRGLSYGAVK
jgi:multiple sugar transport system permease protein